MIKVHESWRQFLGMFIFHTLYAEFQVVIFGMLQIKDFLDTLCAFARRHLKLFPSFTLTWKSEMQNESLSDVSLPINYLLYHLISNGVSRKWKQIFVGKKSDSAIRICLFIYKILGINYEFSVTKFIRSISYFCDKKYVYTFLCTTKHVLFKSYFKYKWPFFQTINVKTTPGKNSECTPCLWVLSLLRRRVGELLRKIKTLTLVRFFVKPKSHCVKSFGKTSLRWRSFGVINLKMSS